MLYLYDKICFCWRNLHHWQKFYTAAGSDDGTRHNYDTGDDDDQPVLVVLARLGAIRQCFDDLELFVSDLVVEHLAMIYIIMKCLFVCHEKSSPLPWSLL